MYIAHMNEMCDTTNHKLPKIKAAEINFYTYISNFINGFPRQHLKILYFILLNGAQINGLTMVMETHIDQNIYFIFSAMYTPHTKRIMEI